MHGRKQRINPNTGTTGEPLSMAYVPKGMKGDDDDNSDFETGKLLTEKQWKVLHVFYFGEKNPYHC